MALLGLAALLVFTAFEEGVTFFYSPSDLAARKAPDGRALRLGGLVEEGSLVRGNGVEVRFRITDLEEAIAVSYVGILPDLFREGQGVIALGRIEPDGVFHANEVLAKHDETYMPPEVAEVLKQSGHWEDAADR
jgi:cytochrome c-type biogenesis protein CcmE